MWPYYWIKSIRLSYTANCWCIYYISFPAGSDSPSLIPYDFHLYITSISVHSQLFLLIVSQAPVPSSIAMPANKLHLVLLCSKLLKQLEAASVISVLRLLKLALKLDDSYVSQWWRTIGTDLLTYCSSVTSGGDWKQYK